MKHPDAKKVIDSFEKTADALFNKVINERLSKLENAILPGDELGYVPAKGRRAMPKQKPGRSIQTYSTPPEFIDAVKRKFKVDSFSYDLAASEENTKARFFFCEEEDSLKQDWSKINGDCWLNPPYSRIGPWAEKCAKTRSDWMLQGVEGRIFFLVPAAVGSNWFAQYVDARAAVYLLNGRISFDGLHPFPKDNLLAVYGPTPRYEVWSWKK
jgi:phage N-6-adenine-methyltransferase